LNTKAYGRNLEKLVLLEFSILNGVVVDEVGQAPAIYSAVATKTQKKDRIIVQELTKDAQWDKLLISDDDFNALLKKARG
jgi:hypothetical protein